MREPVGGSHEQPALWLWPQGFAWLAVRRRLVAVAVGLCLACCAPSRSSCLLCTTAADNRRRRKQPPAPRPRAPNARGRRRRNAATGRAALWPGHAAPPPGGRERGRSRPARPLRGAAARRAPPPTKGGGRDGAPTMQQSTKNPCRALGGTTTPPKGCFVLCDGRHQKVVDMMVR